MVTDFEGQKLIVHKNTENIYRIWKTKVSGRYYLSCNDGMVPSGQEIGETTLHALFEDRKDGE